jgi:hypothetical protein
MNSAWHQPERASDAGSRCHPHRVVVALRSHRRLLGMSRSIDRVRPFTIDELLVEDFAAVVVGLSLKSATLRCLAAGLC